MHVDVDVVVVVVVVAFFFFFFRKKQFVCFIMFSVNCLHICVCVVAGIRFFQSYIYDSRHSIYD